MYNKYCDDQLNLHITSHDNRKLVFGCVVCRLAFKAEQSLLLHMNMKHGLVLLWMCQKCSLANAEYATMSQHVLRVHAGDAANVHSILVACPLV